MARSPQEPLYGHLPPRRNLQGHILGNEVVNYNIFTPEELAARDPSINTYFYRGDRSPASSADPPPYIHPLLPFGGRDLPRKKPPSNESRPPSDESRPLSDESRPPSNEGPPSGSNPYGFELPTGAERNRNRPSLESLKYLLPALFSKPKTSRPLYVHGVTPSIPSPVEVPAPLRKLPLYPKIPDKLPKMMPYPAMDPVLPVQPIVKPLFTPAPGKPLAAETPNGLLDNLFKKVEEARTAIDYRNLPQLSPEQWKLLKKIGGVGVKAVTGRNFNLGV